MAKSIIDIKVIGDASSAVKAFKEIDGAADGLEKTTGGKLKSFATGVAGVFAAAGAFELGKGIINAGSDMNETLSKSNTVFGDSAKQISDWANGAAKGFGQSKQEALNAASTFGNLFVQLGSGTKDAAGMSQQMTELASDFASFHNAAPTDVIDAMTAAFRGEYDAVQRYVPTINAAAVEQKALAMSGKKTTKELNAQDKALATQKLLLEGAGDAAGDFARTSDGAANKQRILSAQIKDAQAKLGTALLPAYQAVLGFILDTVIPGFQKLTGFIKEHKDIIIPVAAVIGGALVAAFVSWAWSAGAAAIATLAATWPIIAIGAAIAALVVGVIYAYKHWGWFKTAVDAVADAGLWLWEHVLKPLGRWFMDDFVPFIRDKLIPTIKDIGKKFGEIGQNVWDFFGDVKDTFDKVVQFITELPGKIKSAASGMWDGIKDAFKEAINFIIRGWNRLELKLPEVDTHIPGVGKVGGWSLDTPDIPYLANGGIVNSPTLAMIGEAGPEAVVPLSRGRGAGLGGNVYITVNAPVGSSAKDIGKELQSYLNAYARAGGR